MRHLVLLLTLTTMATRSAIGADPPAFTRVKVTGRVSYYRAAKTRVDVRRTEQFLDRLERILGPLPTDWHVDLYVHSRRTPLRTDDGLAVVGLTDLNSNRIDTVEAYHPHELVHAVAGQLGWPPVFFAEGLAVALSSEGRWGRLDVDAVARDALAAGVRLDPLIESFGGDPNLSYPLAGSFVAFLLDEYGVDVFVEFVKGCRWKPTAFRQAFHQAFGRTIANATLAWERWLRRKDRPRWTWVDSRTWPGTLERSRGVPGLVAVAGDSGRPKAGEDVPSLVLGGTQR